MIDLTPLEVRKKKGDFRRAMRGYEPGLVDDFLELVADRLEELVRANLGHEDRIRQLEQQLHDYKERERALTDALVSAQELREEMREQAVRDAEQARREAEHEAAQIRAGVAQEIEREEETLRRLRARRAQLAHSYRTLLERELEELDVLAGGVAYRAELDAGELDARPAPPRGERTARGRETSGRTVRRRAEQPADEEADGAEPGPPAQASQPVEPVAAPKVERAPAPSVVRERPASYEARPEPAGPRLVREPAPATPPTASKERAPAPPAETPAGGRVDDEALERSLEQLQVVFARDQGPPEPVWSRPAAAGEVGDRAASAGGATGAPGRVDRPAAPDAAHATAPAEVAEPGGTEVPLAVEEDSGYDDELLLEDAIEEGEPDEKAARPASGVEPWLPKLIEDAP